MEVSTFVPVLNVFWYIIIKSYNIAYIYIYTHMSLT